MDLAAKGHIANVQVRSLYLMTGIYQGMCAVNDPLSVVIGDLDVPLTHPPSQTKYTYIYIYSALKSGVP